MESPKSLEENILIMMTMICRTIIIHKRLESRVNESRKKYICTHELKT